MQRDCASINGERNHHPLDGTIRVHCTNQSHCVSQMIYIFPLAVALDFEHRELAVLRQDVNLEAAPAWQTDQSLGINDLLAQTKLIGFDIGATQRRTKRAGLDIFEATPWTYLNEP